MIESLQAYLDHLQASGAGATVALGVLLVIAALAIAVKGWRS